MFNILTEPQIRINTTNSIYTAALPEVYAALMADEVGAFPMLRPHQRHGWHAFLVQLGALAMYRAKVDTPPDDTKTWTELIRTLTPEFPDDEPWQLAVNDITKPAFMQPPAGSKEREKDYKNTVAAPDELDMLVTSKNHDLKSVVATGASADDWIFALTTLQTMEGFGGAGKLRHFPDEWRLGQPSCVHARAFRAIGSTRTARHNRLAGMSPQAAGRISNDRRRRELAVDGALGRHNCGIFTCQPTGPSLH